MSDSDRSVTKYWINSAVESKKIEVFSNEYFIACAIGGAVACAPTHSMVTPLDLVKCRRQVNSSLYKSNLQGWKTIIKTEGAGAIFTGVVPTFFGYGLQGAGKYGFYEFFKKKYSDAVGPEFVAKYNTAVYAAASASAEFIADIFLCPLEAIKVKKQTTIPPKVPVFGNFASLYSGIVPLWFRQIPYTMVKFASFEKIVEKIYETLPKKKEEYTALQQTGVSFTGGYIAGILCATVSHPADVLVSLVNANKKPDESTGKAVGRIYKQIGFKGLWNGLPTRIFMIGTLTGFQWLIYDSFKIYIGLPTTGGH
ncbi:unnamed protein product [Kuraishia capsulata CBS 1993]|uniref:Mitochondrial phosphate carrier protein n=1 Tax=Kuraishia capsulata CBS 1993 TaxID=1382522 RepID=W6MFV2_9ASCO|nr:uncharacterized protein KUCA_T00000469001 [Kuraishia capsulata CBS 1993]CDK24506.1 unnamed protein product [Kuraishia capsulata CBS 1993]